MEFNEGDATWRQEVCESPSFGAASPPKATTFLIKRVQNQVGLAGGIQVLEPSNEHLVTEALGVLVHCCSMRVTIN